jgi:hypothetical protein
MPILSPDNTIYGQDGKVLHFSFQRFRRDVVEGDCCFMCGRLPSPTVRFNDEHIVPQWLLRRYGMYHEAITLTKGNGARYDHFTVRCCADCNSDLGALVETPTKELLCNGYDSLMSQMSETVAARIYCWCALLFLKMHLKDRTVRFERDRRKPSASVGSAHDWGAMHHIQCIARCPLLKIGLGRGAVGTLFFKRAKMHPTLRERYDQGDISFATTSMVRIDDIAIFAVLNDAGLCGMVLGELFERLGPLHPIQVREAMANLAYCSLRLRDRPTFRTTMDTARRMWIEAEYLPKSLALSAPVDDDFGQLLSFALQHVSLSDDVRASVRAGRASFTLNEKGEFVDIPIV